MVSYLTPDGSSRRDALKVFGTGLAAVGVGSAVGAAESVDADATTDAAVVFEDQEYHYGTVSVAEAVLPVDGFVVLHALGTESEEPIVGVTPPLQRGTYRNLPLELDPYPEGPLTLAAVIHRDTPSDGVFTFPSDGDMPYVGDDGVVYDIAAVRPE